MNYLFHILIMCEIYLILALAMNLLAGYSGMLSMAQAVFYGIGAYVFTLVFTKGNLSFSLSLIIAVLFNLITCIPVILFSTRLRNLYFTLSTLAWQTVVFSLLYNWVKLTKGPFGISNIPKPELLRFKFVSLSEFALLGSIITLLVLFFFIGLHRTPLSRLFQAVRDDQLAVMTFGKKPGYYKAIAILISSAVSAIAGTLFATHFSYIDPTSFTLDESILIISIVLIGGLGSIKGSITGALIYVLLPEALRFVQMPDAVAANMRMIIYALILIFVIMYRPNGFFGKYKFE